jgi:hypothetical protein
VLSAVRQRGKPTPQKRNEKNTARLPDWVALFYYRQATPQPFLPPPRHITAKSFIFGVWRHKHILSEQIPNGFQVKKLQVDVMKPSWIICS